jgi:hypothetical protein
LCKNLLGYADNRTKDRLRRTLMKKMILAGIFTLLAVFATYTSAASKPTFSITPSSPTYKNVMTNYSTYNKYTKQYYVLRSYLEELEKRGGGTLILNSGTYTILNTLYVPSNVTIRFKNGVKMIDPEKPVFKKRLSLLKDRI